MNITIKEISRRLSDQVESVCRKLLPGGKQLQNEWVCGDSGGSSGDSLKVHLDGAHVGEWRDWANQDEHGDLLDLWRFSQGITAKEAITQAKLFLGIKESTFEASEKKYPLPPAGVTKPLTPDGIAIKFFQEQRKIDASIVNRFKVEGDPNKKAIAFPCYSPEGTLINRSYRTLDKEKRVWQDKDCAPCLFGWQALSDQAFKDKAILISEGQIDAMTWTQWGINALSLPNGSGQSWIEYEWKNLEVFDTIYLAFDSDDAGKEITKKAIARLGKHRCLCVRMPHKDANDCLKAGCTSEDARGWMAGAETPSVENLVKAVDLRQRIFQEIKVGAPPPCLNFLGPRWPDWGYFPRPAEVTVWSGEMNQGKSSILYHLFAFMLFKSVKCFMCSLETKAEKIVKRMTSCISAGAVDDQAVDIFLSECGSDLVFADCVGSIKQDTLLEMMYFAFHRHGVTQYAIDSLMRIEGLEEDYPAQGEFLNKLQKFAKETDSHVHLVCHNRKPSTGEKGNAGLRIKGSSLIPNNADNIVITSRNPEKEKLREEGKLTPEKDAELHDSEVRVCKQRETGWQGRILLRFDPGTGIFSNAAKSRII